MQGKHYEFVPFENDLVEVQSAGNHIEVGYKLGKPDASSWWEPNYPFAPPPPQFAVMQNGEWSIAIESSSPEETRAILTRGADRHVLTLTVIDPNVKPMPVRVSWE